MLVSVQALIGWLQVRGCRFKSWIFSSFTYFSNMLCAVKGFRPHGLLVYRLCLPPDTPIIYSYFVNCQVWVVQGWINFCGKKPRKLWKFVCHKISMCTVYCVMCLLQLWNFCLQAAVQVIFFVCVCVGSEHIRGTGVNHSIDQYLLALITAHHMQRPTNP